MMTPQEALEYFDLKKLSGFDHLEKTEPRTEISLPTMSALEIQAFHKQFLNHTQTRSGAAMLAYSLVAPPRDVGVIRARQEAVRELKEKGGLRDKISNTLGYIGSLEGEFLDLLYPDLFSSDSEILNTRELIKTSIESFGGLDEAESPYLRERIQALKKLKGSDIHRLSKGIIYRQGFRTPLHAGQLNLACLPWTVPATIARFRPLTGLFSAALTAMFCYGTFKGSWDMATPDSKTLTLMISALTTAGVGFISANLAGLYERALSVRPLRRKLKFDEGARTAYSTFGTFDEVLALANFTREMEKKGYAMCLPEIVDAEKHRIHCENLVNLIQAEQKPYVPNRYIDIGSNCERLNFVTGPNSGGKTSFSKALATLQILAQMGAYVPASRAVLSPADRIIYQVGINDLQEDEEGGYGTQLRQTRDILEKAGLKSFLFVDDLMSGTEETAMARQTKNQFYGLHHTGADVIMITHRHDLAREFREKTGRGNYLQVEFDGDIPTRQIVPGIALTSRADLVERRVNMGEDAIEELLRARGFLGSEQSLYDLGEKKP